MATQQETRGRVAADTTSKSVELTRDDPTLCNYSIYTDSSLKVPVTVINDDCLQVALDVKAMGRDRIAVMHLTSGKRLERASLHGPLAQEDTIYFRTTLGHTLADVKAEVYPFEQDVIFTPNVLIIKGREYQDLPYHESISVVSVTAYRSKAVKKLLTPDQVHQLERRIRLCMIACEEHDIQTVVLGALGCGVYRNNPVQVAQCFRTVLSERKYVPKVYFAILETEGVNHTGFGPLGTVFAQAFL